MGSSPIESMIDAAVSCVRCGAKGIGNCDCWVKLWCPKCNKSRWAARHETDPPAASTVAFPCPECADEQSKGTLRYYARNGVEIAA